ncbi:MAG TPA: hypothetical protein VHI54_01700 [Actinomycetota bacterium]|nr:hypothetical protein [Actinomycetota bacterium]
MKALVRSILLAALLTGTLIVGSRPAWACSCVPPNPRQMLAEFDGAFVGEFVGRKGSARPLPFVGQETSVFTFRVTRSYKGDLGPLVDVESASYGAACGLEVTAGDRIGLFLEKEPDRWTSNLCLQVSPRDLTAAAKSAGAGEAAAVPGAPAPKDMANDAGPASNPRPRGSPVWRWVVIASLAAIAPIVLFALRSRRSAGQ